MSTSIFCTLFLFCTLCVFITVLYFLYFGSGFSPILYPSFLIDSVSIVIMYCLLTKRIPPQYNRHGWLGVKNHLPTAIDLFVRSSKRFLDLGIHFTPFACSFFVVVVDDVDVVVVVFFILFMPSCLFSPLSYKVVHIFHFPLVLWGKTKKWPPPIPVLFFWLSDVFTILSKNLSWYCLIPFPSYKLYPT